MADVALFILWHPEHHLALMENRPDLGPGTQDYWVYPGGQVEPGESAYSALLRECREEVSVHPSTAYYLPHLVPGDLEHTLITRPPFGTRQHERSPDGWRSVPYLVLQWRDLSTPVPFNNLDRHDLSNPLHRNDLAWLDPRPFARKPVDSFTCTGQIARMLVEVFQLQL